MIEYYSNISLQLMKKVQQKIICLKLCSFNFNVAFLDIFGISYRPGLVERTFYVM